MKNLLTAFNMVVSMFTIIPLPRHLWDEKAGKYIMMLYPTVGLIVGVIWYGIWWALSKIGCSTILLAAILLAIPYLITGFIHLDGFMDVSDALLSRRSMEEKLRILKDSTVGAFAVISLGLVFILQFASIYTLLQSNKNMLVLIMIPIISRCISGYFMLHKEPIGESYFGKLFKEGTGIFQKSIIIIVGISVTLLVSILNLQYGIVSIIMIVIGSVLVRNSTRELGGMNGDVAGYTLVLTEVIGVLTLGIM